MKQTPLSVPDVADGLSRRFAAIAQYYRTVYRDLKCSGREPYRMTELGAWATSRAPHVFFFFKTFNLCSYRLFLDLGSGDGIVSCIASLFTRSLGIEIDADLCLVARNAAHSLGLETNVQFICGDYRDHRIDRADCLYLYPDKPFDHLGERLLEWRGTVLVYGPHIAPPKLEALRSLRCGNEQMVLYVSPAQCTMHGGSKKRGPYQG